MVVVVEELLTFPEPLVPHESSPLFHCTFTVVLPKHFECLRTIFTQFPTKLGCITQLKIGPYFARRGCSRYLCAEHDPASTTAFKQMTQVSF
ncbi:hypothetical protein TNCV_500311 [Trichonephila clavipes]|nr:hypothetical protein TNCV_500311 [Trichonephila clavipes]